MQRLIIPDLWILLSGLLWSWYRIHCRRSLYFCAWMIRWYLNLAQNLKMFQNCLTMLYTTVPTIWMDTALWVSCSAYLSGIGIKYLIFPFQVPVPPLSGCILFTKALYAAFMTSSDASGVTSNISFYFILLYPTFCDVSTSKTVRKPPFSNFQPPEYKTEYNRPKKLFSESNKQTLSETQKVPEAA